MIDYTYDAVTNTDTILPGSRVLVYDAWAGGANAYWKGVGGKYCTATVVRRYGFICKYIEREHGREAAKYPDCVDVIFDHNNRLSRGHFTDGVQLLRKSEK